MKTLENKPLTVGRAGHDPATNGLKGRGTKRQPPQLSPYGSADVGARNPRVNQADGVGRATLYFPRLS